MSEAPRDPAVERLARERDLYRRLLELGERTAIEPFLEEALALVVEVVGARHGYLELREPDDDGAEPRWSRAHGFSPEEVAVRRAVISRGIVAATLASGETIVTPSAFLDPRFRDRESARPARIDAVLCAPIGNDPPLGVLYPGGGPPAACSPRTTVRPRSWSPGTAARRLLAAANETRGRDPTAAVRRALRLDGVVGRSAAPAAVLQEGALVAPLDASVLLTGPSGTGKSQIARVIHDNGPRRGGPFVEINCAALPVELVERELFGALPGAHSTATRRIAAEVAAAERGTFVLDEVGEFPLSAQGKLLQLLHTGSYFPLGGTKPRRARRGATSAAAPGVLAGRTASARGERLERRRGRAPPGPRAVARLQLAPRVRHRAREAPGRVARATPPGVAGSRVHPGDVSGLSPGWRCGGAWRAPPSGASPRARRSRGGPTPCRRRRSACWGW